MSTFASAAEHHDVVTVWRATLQVIVRGDACGAERHSRAVRERQLAVPSCACRRAGGTPVAASRDPTPQRIVSCVAASEPPMRGG